ncbi:MAG: thiol reductant ABC exporter subunit CydC, partial [Bacillota bacterium]
MRIFLRLWRLLAPYRGFIFLATILGALTVGSNIGLLAVSALLISRAALHPPILDLMTLIVGVRFFGISRAVFRYLERYFTHDVTFRILSQIRVWFYRKLEPLAPAHLMDYGSGELLSRIVGDVDTLKFFYLRVLAPPLVAFMVLLGVFLFLAWFHLQAALVVLFFFLLAAVGIPLGIRSLSRGIGRRMVEVKGALNVLLVDSIRGMTEITAFGQGWRQQVKIEGLSRELIGLQGRVAGFTGLSGALVMLTMNLALWCVLVLTIPLVAGGKLDGIYLAMLALGAMGSFEAVLPLPLVYQHMEESMEAARRLFEITDTKLVVQDRAGHWLIPHRYDLEVKGLRFRYRENDSWVLDGLDFVLPQGGRLAIVGPSGAGKSTFVHLLLRFWEYEEGSITLGNHEIRAYSPETLRQLMGVVTQQTHIFNATIGENLLLAKPGASPEELVDAIRKAQLYDFIQSLPHGYDTYVGEEGLKLSGGQRQRLAIARVLLKNAPILILDEATVGLDPVTEKEVMGTIYGLMEGRTTLVITHRLTGLEVMDQILFLEGGKVVEQGT